MELLLGFGCGVAFCFLLKYLNNCRISKIDSGNETFCKSCTFRTAVLNSLDDES